MCQFISNGVSTLGLTWWVDVYCWCLACIRLKNIPFIKLGFGFHGEVMIGWLTASWLHSESWDNPMTFVMLALLLLWGLAYVWLSAIAFYKIILCFLGEVVSRLLRVGWKLPNPWHSIIIILWSCGLDLWWLASPRWLYPMTFYLLSVAFHWDFIGGWKLSDPCDDTLSLVFRSELFICLLAYLRLLLPYAFRNNQFDCLTLPANRSLRALQRFHRT